VAKRPVIRFFRVPAACLLLLAVCAAVAGPAARTDVWPGNRDGLALLWPSADRRPEVFDPATGAGRPLRVEAHGAARFGRFFEMDTRGGWLAAEGVDDSLAAACRKTGQLTVEALVTPASVPQAGPARIIALAAGADNWNFVVAQQDDRLVLGLKTGQKGGADQMALMTLGKATAGGRRHVVVTYSRDRLACYLDGEAVPLAGAPKGDFSDWTPARLVFGGEPGGKPWRGQIEGVAIYSRALGADEAKAHYSLAAARLKGRKPAERLVVDARLASVTATPDPKAIAPYVRALVVNEYEVEKVVEGRFDGKRLAAAQWAILDVKVVPAAWKPGERYRLALERFDDHPELDSERLIMDGVKPDVPLFFDVER
jgi:hypothetical protein